tara:strand:- start:317 stop:1333 length:1017 start_codon:yes stop_codon:yes gene_type:complete
MPKYNPEEFQNTEKLELSYPSSWKNALMKTPGPKTVREYSNLFLKGVCMGTADIVPGVSGGTIAFITGIYEDLLSAISSINGKFFSHIFRLNFKKALSNFHLRFLFTLFLGITAAIISTANVMHFLLNQYPIQIWSVFFGLILASILILIHKIKKRFSTLPTLIIGTTISYLITNLIPLNTPENYWFIFFCGMIAICAMILPGLSGSFVLLILGKYAYITAALRNPLLIENIEIISIFSSGCLIGIILFSKILRYGMVNWYDHTLALLTGIMIGSMSKVWPWKITLESQIIVGKEYVLRDVNIWPAINSELFISLVLICMGFFTVLIIEKFSRLHSKN